MRKQLLLILTLSPILAVTACRTYSGGGSEVDENGKATFQATILEVRDGYYLVEPVDGSTELNSADQITVPITNINPSPEPEVGDVLKLNMTVRSQNHILHKLLMFIAFVLSNN